MVHYGLFLFDYNGFHREAQPLVERADAGDHNALLEHAERVACKMTGRWILEDLGTGIERFEQLRTYHPSQKQACGLAGIAFLIILSQYLEGIDYT
jgi:hypothetical protein